MSVRQGSGFVEPDGNPGAARLCRHKTSYRPVQAEPGRIFAVRDTGFDVFRAW